jgi:hypothetical protein
MSDINNNDFRPDDFVFVNKDNVIKDKKLETKPTTFFKDAMRRFVKNKSSVFLGQGTVRNH